MAIDRGPWNALVDDDGSNLVGTVWNKDKIKTVILDPTDAALLAIPAATPTYGTWTPVDASGAGLVMVFVTGNYARFDKLVSVWCQVVYPATANGAVAKLGGLPFPVAVNGGLTHGYGPLSFWAVSTTAPATLIQPFDLNGDAKTNANMSGVNVIMNGTYLTT